MEDRKKRAIVPAMLLVALLGVGAYFALRPGEAPPEPLAAPAASSIEAVSGAPSAEPAPSVAAAEPSEPEPAVTPAPSEPPAERAATGPATKAKAAPAAAERREVTPVATAAPSASASASAAAAPTAAPSQSAAAKRTGDEPLIIGQFSNRVGPQFKLLRVTCLLDGQAVYTGPGGPAVELFRRAPSGGNHTISIIAEYQGNGGGVFSYWDGYKFTVRGNKAFSANPEGRTQVSVAAVERGGTLTRHEDRLGLNINVK